jgi:hypothetical protein
MREGQALDELTDGPPVHAKAFEREASPAVPNAARGLREGLR